MPPSYDMPDEFKRVYRFGCFSVTVHLHSAEASWLDGVQYQFVLLMLDSMTAYRAKHKKSD